ncbi:MAG: alkyl hydroperoxide reductase and/or thiol-specific antioxidant family (AhpC/TSA) protein [Bacteroidetes bacterium]|nr:alkyl hydroperoxide reductase and/or thiol-specific antioxidant family (AhpC/TSA) protein [Bacteroidota bacterium]
MKKFALFFTLLAVSINFSFVKSNALEELALNAAIPQGDYKMKDVSGKEVSLNEIKTAKGLLVIFSCNTCPYVKLSETRIKEYSDLCLSNGIGCIIVNSNEAQRSEDDSFEKMTAYYAAQKLKCPYTVDVKSHLANAFGATRTPQCFLFNAKGLVYKGAIDDNVKDPAAVKAAYLKDAINAVAKGSVPATQETKSIGCTIKRVE